LIARIWLLWLFIVASPFIVLKESFSGIFKLGKLDEYLSIKSVIGIVFAPVVTVAALSLSLIFLSALISWFQSPTDSVKFQETIGVEINPNGSQQNEKTDTIKFLWISEMEISKLHRGETLDWFSWILINFFAIGLMWMIVFAAIKANKLGEGIWGKVQEFGGNFIQTLPIVPIPWWWRVGVGSMYNVLSTSPQRKIEAMQARDTKFVSDLFREREKKLTPEQVNKVINLIRMQAVKKKAIEEVEAYLQQEKISWTFESVASANIPAIYTATLTTPGIKANLPENTQTALITKAEKDIKSMLGTEDDSNTINTKINEEQNKNVLNMYLNTEEKYEQKIWNKTITITKKEWWWFTSTVTETP